MCEGIQVCHCNPSSVISKLFTKFKHSHPCLHAWTQSQGAFLPDRCWICSYSLQIVKIFRLKNRITATKLYFQAQALKWQKEIRQGTKLYEWFNISYTSGNAVQTCSQSRCSTVKWWANHMQQSDTSKTRRLNPDRTLLYFLTTLYVCT